jgi:hypothetical protein
MTDPPFLPHPLPSNLGPSSPVPSSLGPQNLAPSTLGEILDRTAQLYRSRFLVFLGISLVPTATVLIPACGIFVFLVWMGSNAWTGSNRIGPSTTSAAGVLGILLFVVIGLIAVPVFLGITALAGAAMNLAVSRTYLGEKTSIRDAYKTVWRRGWHYIWLLILEGLIVVAAPAAVWVLLMAISAGVAAVGGVAGGTLFGLVVFLVLAALLAYGCWMLLRLSLAFPSCVVEQIGAWAAIKRSTVLSKGAKGRIILLYLLVGALNMLLSMGITVPFVIILAMIPGTNSPEHAQTIGMVFLFVVYGAGLVIQALTRPLYGIALTLFYYDQRIRQEGFDIEWMMLRAGMVERPPVQAAASHQAAPIHPSTEIQSTEQAPAVSGETI